MSDGLIIIDHNTCLPQKAFCPGAIVMTHKHYMCLVDMLTKFVIRDLINIIVGYGSDVVVEIKDDGYKLCGFAISYRYPAWSVSRYRFAKKICVYHSNKNNNYWCDVVDMIIEETLNGYEVPGFYLALCSSKHISYDDNFIKSMPNFSKYYGSVRLRVGNGLVLGAINKFFACHDKKKWHVHFGTFYKDRIRDSTNAVNNYHVGLIIDTCFFERVIESFNQIKDIAELYYDYNMF